MITGSYYAASLNRLVDEIMKKRPHLKKKKILFYEYNAPSHTSKIARAKKLELGIESLPHSRHSPDLAPNYLFPNLKRCLCGRRFESNEEVEWETEVCFITLVHIMASKFNIVITVLKNDIIQKVVHCDISAKRRTFSNVQGFASKVLTLYEEEVRRRRIRRRLRSAVRL